MNLLKHRREHFNSHPHEEDDETWDLLENYLDISTHILTKRMTICDNDSDFGSDISTHILTKRMTNVDNEEGNEEDISTHILTKRMTNVPS